MLRPVRWLLKLVSHNFGWKLLSLAMAVILWVLVASEPELSTFTSVQLEYKNLPDDLEISSEPVPTVSLELRGSSGVLSALTDRGTRPAVILDMSNVFIGERTFTVDSGSVKLPHGVRLVRAQPSQVRFNFERRMTRRVPVVVQFDGDGADGYIVADKQVEPATLTVVGPASHVARVTAANTDPVDVSGVVGTSQFRSNAYVNDPYVRFQSSPRVTVTVTMRKR
jgi:YbbR domain-containing protein